MNNEKKVLIEIAQQLAWLTAACRRPVFGELTLSDILCFVTDKGTLHISTLPVKEVVRHDEACWIPLFSGSVIAHRWPIPDRGNEIGIELPFHLMTALVGPLYPMKFDGGFCLKVHSRILFRQLLRVASLIVYNGIMKVNLMHELYHHGTKRTREIGIRSRGWKPGG